LIEEAIKSGTFSSNTIPNPSNLPIAHVAQVLDVPGV